MNADDPKIENPLKSLKQTEKNKVRRDIQIVAGTFAEHLLEEKIKKLQQKFQQGTDIIITFDF